MAPKNLFASKKVKKYRLQAVKKRNNQNSKDKRQDYNMKKGDTNDRTT